MRARGKCARCRPRTAAARAGSASSEGRGVRAGPALAALQPRRASAFAAGMAGGEARAPQAPSAGGPSRQPRLATPAGRPSGLTSSRGGAGLSARCTSGEASAAAPPTTSSPGMPTARRRRAAALRRSDAISCGPSRSRWSRARMPAAAGGLVGVQETNRMRGSIAGRGCPLRQGQSRGQDSTGMRRSIAGCGCAPRQGVCLFRAQESAGTRTERRSIAAQRGRSGGRTRQQGPVGWPGRAAGLPRRSKMKDKQA